MQGVVRVDLGLGGNVRPARDVGCSGFLIFILQIALSTTDRSIFLGLPINLDRSTGTQPLAADKVVCGSYGFSSGITSCRYPRLTKG